MNSQVLRTLVGPALSLASGPLGFAQVPDSLGRAPFRELVRGEDSGLHSGHGETHRLAYESLVYQPDASWVRLLFDEFDLGTGSYVRMTSLFDQSTQALDAEHMREWGGFSAGFNGDSVLLQLFVAPQDRDVRVRLDSIRVDHPDQPALGGSGQSLCGGDSKVPSTDDRVGRMRIGGSVCTAFRTPNGAFASAGHCVDSDPDDCGPLTPDGVATAGGFIEFNVPTSLANGATQFADADDQYAMDYPTLVWRYDNDCQNLGKDWAVFGVFANPNTGLMPHEVHGAPYRLTRETPDAFETMRVTGFGSDSTPAGTSGGGNEDNFTHQTATGPYVDELFLTGDLDISHEYQVDTTGGNSGSPILWEANGLVIGVHTNGGCDVSFSGNHGTSFEVDQLEAALHGFAGPATYVDSGHPLPLSAHGSIFRPFVSLAGALPWIPQGGVVSLFPGDYPASQGNAVTISNSMTLTAPTGPVRLGT